MFFNIGIVCSLFISIIIIYYNNMVIYMLLFVFRFIYNHIVTLNVFFTIVYILLLFNIKKIFFVFKNNFLF